MHPTRRRLIGAALAAAAGLAACGPAPPAKARLQVCGELVPPFLLQTPYAAEQPQVAMSFVPWPPGPGASLLALDGTRFAARGVRSGLTALSGMLDLVAFSPQGIAPGAWAAFSDSGRQLGVPMVQSRLVVLYAGDRAAAPPPGWDWAALLARLAAARRPALGDLSGLRLELWVARVAAHGGSVASAQGTLPATASPAAVAAWLDVAALAAFAVPGATLAGGAAFAFAFWVLPSTIRALQSGGLRVGVAAFPGRAVPARARGHGIPIGAPEPGAALQFLTWSAEAVCQRTLLLDGYVPVVDGLATALPPLGAAAGADPAALRPDPGADAFLPAPLRLSAATKAAFEAALAASPAGLSAAAAASAYAAAARSD